MQTSRRDSPNLRLGSEDTLKRQQLERLTLLEEKAARIALQDRWFWLTRCTKTKDEQDKTGNPYKPFPEREYIRHLLQLLDDEPIVFLEKSRSVMASWTVSAWAAYRMFTVPATGVVFQSKDEKRAVHDVTNVKTLWDNTLAPLKARWKPKKDVPAFEQAYNRFELENGSWCMGVPGDPDKIRSEHPTIVVLDEAAHIPRGEESFNVAQGTRCLHIICLSSAYPGWFQEQTQDAVPVDWPVKEAA